MIGIRRGMVRRHANTDTRFSIDNQPLLPRAARSLRMASYAAMFSMTSAIAPLPRHHIDDSHIRPDGREQRAGPGKHESERGHGPHFVARRDAEPPGGRPDPP